MFRKLTLSALAVAALGMAAFAPTSAEAGFKHKHWHNEWHGHAYYGGPVYYGGYYASCWTKRWVKTPYGPRLKRVYICY
ncbi:MAG: hypothetical protein RO009_14280 [Pseudorhodoplanes sp.]|nr:hypothetical protein [Pseudorhodoplanes sp.]